ncbi:hypothetical protein Dip510_001382 [Elusimicrobium posterum]|uniref:trypsin-like serine protease n=1 Tax=Elusimicrobium posterum TaxID=3116653 RepID=UPI003C75C4C7
MKNFLAVLFLTCCAVPSFAQCLGPEEFADSYEYTVTDEDDKTHRCQAVKIHKDWFLTAAHCVVPHCDDKCEIDIELMPTNPGAVATIKHTDSRPKVFVPEDFDPSSARNSSKDIALIKADYANTIYYDRVINAQISSKDFQASLDNDFKLKEAWNKARNGKSQHPLFYPAADKNYKIDSSFSVISIKNGYRAAYCIKTPYYYVAGADAGYIKKLRVDRGLSGGGILSGKGVLVGLLSATIGNGEFFVLTPFSKENYEFITSHTGSVYKATPASAGALESAESQDIFLKSLQNSKEVSRR